METKAFDKWDAQMSAHEKLANELYWAGFNNAEVQLGAAPFMEKWDARDDDEPEEWEACSLRTLLTNFLKSRPDCEFVEAWEQEFAHLAKMCRTWLKKTS